MKNSSSAVVKMGSWNIISNGCCCLLASSSSLFGDEVVSSSSSSTIEMRAASWYHDAAVEALVPLPVRLPRPRHIQFVILFLGVIEGIISDLNMSDRDVQQVEARHCGR